MSDLETKLEKGHFLLGRGIFGELTEMEADDPPEKEHLKGEDDVSSAKSPPMTYC